MNSNQQTNSWLKVTWTLDRWVTTVGNCYVPSHSGRETKRGIINTVMKHDRWITLRFNVFLFYIPTSNSSESCQLRSPYQSQLQIYCLISMEKSKEISHRIFSTKIRDISLSAFFHLSRTSRARPTLLQNAVCPPPPAVLTQVENKGAAVLLNHSPKTFTVAKLQLPPGHERRRL
jgi:hypothetical protein